MQEWPITIIVLSSTIFLSLIQKLQFNAFCAWTPKPRKLKIDKWQIIDVVFAGLTLALVIVLWGLPSEFFESET